MTNHLSIKKILPNFSSITTQNIIPTINHILDNYRLTIKTILEKNSHFNWDNLCQPLEEANNLLSSTWSPISHLHAVKNTKELRNTYDKCLSILSEFNTWMGQHISLYQAYRSLRNSHEFDKLDQAQNKSIENILRNFELSGINLPIEKKNVIVKLSLNLLNYKLNLVTMF